MHFTISIHTHAQIYQSDCYSKCQTQRKLHIVCGERTLPHFTLLISSQSFKPDAITCYAGPLLTSFSSENLVARETYYSNEILMPEFP